MKIRNYTTYLKGSLNLEEIYDMVGDSFTDLKKDLLDLINNTIEESSDKSIKREDLKDFMSKYIQEGKDVNMIDDLIEDNDIFNFYLKHQSDFDELLNDTGYMEKTPQENNIFSLYDITIDGTKQGIWNLVEILYSDIF